MSCRALIFGVVIATAAPVCAQVVGPSPQDGVAKRQIQTFELALRSAVEVGGQHFAERASKVVPNMYWFPADPVVIDSFVLPDGKALLFQVRVPGLRPTTLAFVDQFNRGMRPAPVSPMPEGVQSIASLGRTSATGGDVPADPMTTSSVILDPNREYVTAVKSALLDAILDSSGVLTLGPDEFLIVAASAVDIAVSNPLYNQPSSKMYLEIKGSDLTDFRDRKITRDVAKTRIVERRF